jgi:hypothetical protein
VALTGAAVASSYLAGAQLIQALVVLALPMIVALARHQGLIP